MQLQISRQRITGVLSTCPKGHCVDACIAFAVASTLRLAGLAYLVSDKFSKGCVAIDLDEQALPFRATKAILFGAAMNCKKLSLTSALSQMHEPSYYQIPNNIEKVIFREDTFPDQGALSRMLSHWKYGPNQSFALDDCKLPLTTIRENAAELLRFPRLKLSGLNKEGVVSLSKETKWETKSLVLKDCDMGNECANALMQNENAKQLVRIGLINCGLTEVECVSWNCTHMTSLDLSFNPLTLGGLQAVLHFIEGNSTITKLSLAHCCFADSGARDIALMLENNKGVAKLNLAANDINYDGVKQLYVSLRRNNTLKVVDLSNNVLDRRCVVLLGSDHLLNGRSYVLRDTLGDKYLKYTLQKKRGEPEEPEQSVSVVSCEEQTPGGP